MTEASDAGLASVEHLFQVWYDTSSREVELRRAITAVPIAGGEYNGWLNKMHPYEYAAARSFDRHKAARVFARLAQNGTRVTPTLVLHTFTDMPVLDDVKKAAAAQPAPRVVSAARCAC